MSTWSAFQPLPSFASGPVADVGNLYNRQAVAVISDPPIVQFWVASSTGRQPLPMYIVALRSVSHRSQGAASCVPRVRHHIRRGFRPSSGHVVDTVLHSDKVHNSFDTCELPAVTAICLRTARLRDMSWLRGRYQLLHRFAATLPPGSGLCDLDLASRHAWVSMPRGLDLVQTYMCEWKGSIDAGHYHLSHHRTESSGIIVGRASPVALRTTGMQ